MKKIDLFDNWYFYRDNTSIMTAFNPSQIKKEPLTLPHDAMLSGGRNPDNPTGAAGAYYPGENYIYEKTLYADKSWNGKKIILEFEGVYQKCLVYINDQFVCRNDYGYTGFTADIGAFLKYGENNEILVKVRNGSVPNSRWYSGAGIFRPVYLWIGNDIYIEKDSVRITTPEVANDISQVNIDMTAVNQSCKIQKTIFYIEILDIDNNLAADQKIPVTLFPQFQEQLHATLYVRNITLWSIENPNLYTVRITITSPEQYFDSAEISFGFRHIQIDPDNGLRINGIKTRLRGACIHHDNGILGAAEYNAAAVRKIKKLKEAGFNAIRTSHNPASKEILNACDHLGMLVMEESFDQWTREKNPYDYANEFSDSWKKQIERIVAKDYNHPSVIFYCIGNEIQELATAQGAQLNRTISNYVRFLDSSRFITNAINGMMTVMKHMEQITQDLGLTGDSAGDVNDVMTNLMEHNDEMTSHPLLIDKLEEVFLSLDVSGYNYMRKRSMIDTERDSCRIVIGTETFPSDIDLNWKVCMEHPAVLGDFTWTGWDYLGEAGIGIEKYQCKDFHAPWPAYLAYCGDIDITGFRRPFSYYREIVFGLRKTPYIAVRYPERYGKEYYGTPWSVPESISSWSFDGYEGKPCLVEVYSDADEIELFINDQSIERKKCGPEHRFKAVFDVIFQPGNIKAVAYKDGIPVQESSLTSAEKETFLTLNSDKNTLKANHQDLCYIDICLTDKNGVIKPYQPQRIRLSITGAGTLMGVSSSNPITTEQFDDPEHTTYMGRLQAIVRSTGTPGVIQLNAISENGLKGSIKLVCIPEYSKEEKEV